MNKLAGTLCIALVSLTTIGLLGACQSAFQPTEIVSVEPMTITPFEVGATATPLRPTPTNTTTPTIVLTSIDTPSTGEGPTPPPLLFIADNKLYENQPDGTMLLVADLGKEDDILDAIRVKDNVFVLRGKGIQRIEMKGGKTEMVVQFEKTPQFGELTRTTDDNLLLYSNAVDSACSSTGVGAEVGLYQIDKDTSRIVFAKDEGYIRPLGLTANQRNFYGLPLGCDPEFDRFVLISMDKGEITKELLTWDESTKEYGNGYAALSPDSHFLAYATVRYIRFEEPLKHGLGIYNLDTLTIARYELPNPPSHIFGGLLWSPDSRRLYFALRPGVPEEEPSSSYGLWSLDIQTGKFSPVTNLDDPYMHLLSISTDGQWILLMPERMQSVTYVHLPTGEQMVIHLPTEGISRLVH